MSSQTNRQPSNKCQRPAFVRNSPEPSVTSTTIDATRVIHDRKGKRDVTTIRPRIWKAVGVILVALGLQLFGGMRSFAQQADVAALADAKTAAGQEAHGSSAVDAVSLPVPVKPSGKLITFDVPGAVNGTNPSSINSQGVITGFYNDANFVGHGFLRKPVKGTITTIDIPGDVGGTYPTGVNSQSAITGSWDDANFVAHGFLVDSDGTVITFDAPGAVADMIGTFPLSINSEGEITGVWYDANFVGHGFLRAADGTITNFDAPDAAFPTGTYPLVIDEFGVVIGIYGDAQNTKHGFMRARNGTFTTFDPPGQISNQFVFSSPGALSENPQGVVTGAYFQPISGNPFGGDYDVFARARNGTFTTFAAADYPPCCIWSFSSGIDPGGTITGVFNDGFSINHGFLRAPNGTVKTFDVPGSGTGSNQGTVPLGINVAGVVIGYYSDSKNLHHGFILHPKP